MKSDTSSELDLARECMYRYLAAALAQPDERAWQLLSDRVSQAFVRESSQIVREWVERPDSNYTQFGSRWLNAVSDRFVAQAEPPIANLEFESVRIHLPESLDAMQSEHARVFGMLLCSDCAPYETEFVSSSEPFFRAQQMADVAGYFRAFGLTPSRRVNDRPDHVALELEFMAFVLTKKRLAGAIEDNSIAERTAICQDAEHSFFTDHLAAWLPVFAVTLRHQAQDGFYVALADFLAAFISAERRLMGVAMQPIPVGPDVLDEEMDYETCGSCAHNCDAPFCPSSHIEGVQS